MKPTQPSPVFGHKKGDIRKHLFKTALGDALPITVMVIEESDDDPGSFWCDTGMGFKVKIRGELLTSG